ncbi:hypothetical protein Leryth_010341 [Lithospermum erythrorhizon]|nr:hypothetical protein Leryth_010341 [Lithospermum erythrorhizon]
MARYGRVYQDETEGKPTKTHKLGVNQFADITNEEFRATRNGFKMSSTPRFSRTSFIYENVTDVPTSMDWREKGAVTPIKDQGQCGCYLGIANEQLQKVAAIDSRKIGLI